jgi:hypothetical protein
MKRKGKKKKNKGRGAKEKKRKMKKEGHNGISPSYLYHTARRSCFAKRFSKTAPVLSQNPLH